MLEKRNFYINGSWVAPKKTSDIEVINPATEKACAVISLGSKDDVNDAVLSAKEAFKTWGYSTREDRIALLETFYTLYKKRWNDITDAIIQEMKTQNQGQVIHTKRDSDLVLDTVKDTTPTGEKQQDGDISDVEGLIKPEDMNSLG